MLMYWMIQMERLIKKSVKGSFQRMLQKYTTNRRTSWFVWIGMTWITQSSSLVSLLVVVFVWAGLFTIQSWIAMVVGANIGTTFSSLLIALLGFGKRSISAFALPLIWLGWLWSIFLPRESRKRLAWIFVSLWLIFLGIAFLKDAVWWLSEWINLIQYEWFGILWFFLVWVVVTTLIQSSHTVVILALTALYSWLISPSMALGIVIWSNIGTTTTVLIASLGGSHTKRQVAFSHLGFNVILSVIGLLYRQPLYQFSQWLVGSTSNITISIAIFNTLLNTSTTLVVMPFLWQFMSLIKKIFPSDEKQQRLKSMSMQTAEVNTGSIWNTTLKIIDEDMDMIRDEVLSYSTLLFGVSSTGKRIDEEFDNESHKKIYEKLYEWLTHCDTLLQSLASQELNKKQEKRLRDLEERIDCLFDLLEWAKNLVQPVQHITEIEHKELVQRLTMLRKWIEKSCHHYASKKSFSQKQFKKIPHLGFTQLNTQEVNHYDIVRINDYLKKLFTQISE